MGPTIQSSIENVAIMDQTKHIKDIDLDLGLVVQKASKTRRKVGHNKMLKELGRCMMLLESLSKNISGMRHTKGKGLGPKPWPSP